ncbi:MAG: BrxE family protein [Proteobacteria bacterium]|nr:BrxE family protein [Pseudomonadota bacterium]
MSYLSTELDLELLFKLRLVVARFGEMDLAKWWNTRGQLGRLGTATLRRGFPRTHRFAQARSVFAVAAHRCTEVFNPPGCFSLWHLPEDVEEAFDVRWEQWVDNAAEWDSFFEELASLSGSDLTGHLQAFGLVQEPDLMAFSKLRRSAEGRAVPVPGAFSGSDSDVALLALGFGRGEPGALSVPYVQKAEA